MSKQIEAMKVALEALESLQDWPGAFEKCVKAEHALREALEKEALHKLAAESLTVGLRLDDWDKIVCVNHDCDKCKALAEQPAQEPVARLNKAPDYAWSTIADYEKEVGFEVNIASVRLGLWREPRTTFLNR